MMKEKYETLPLTTLKELAKARGLKGISTMKKAQVIELMLQEDEKEQEKIIEIQEAATEQFEDSVESANIQNKKAFVIREEDGYLNVYFGEEDALYMYTGIAYQGLPEELKKEISNGKTFDTLEDLYRFLESYSS